MPQRLGIAVVSLALGWAPTVMGATMYKCQAADGRITYTDQPCAGGATEQKRIEPQAAPPPAPPKQPPAGPAVKNSYVRPQPVVVPPLPPPADLSGLPKDAQGRPIVVQSSNYALVVDPDRRMRPVDVISDCGALITGCADPRKRSLDACFMSAPQCTSARPWDDPAYKACCPSQCWTQYEQRRIAGAAPIAAFRETLYGSGDAREGGCIPIR